MGKISVRLVLLPGMHGTSELFLEFMNCMPESTQIEAIHYPTDASPSYSELLTAVEAFVPTDAPYFLLAESYSTPLAIQFAATHPPYLRGLILCAGFATCPIHGWRKILASLVGPWAFLVPLPKAFVLRYLLGSDAPASLCASVQAAIRSVKPAVLAARLRHVLQVDARLAFKHVSVPVLYLQARQDRLVSEASFAELQSLNGEIKVARLEGPHLLIQRQTAECAQAISEFIQAID